MFFAVISSFRCSSQLIEASLDALVTIGYDGKITDVNETTERVAGYSRDELIGTDFTNYFTEPEKTKKGYQQKTSSNPKTQYLYPDSGN